MHNIVLTLTEIRKAALLSAIMTTILCFAISVGVAAQAESSSKEIAVNADAYEVFELTSEDIGETYVIQVALPMAYGLNPDAGFRVVYVMDADISFGTASEIAFLAETDFLNTTSEPAILVGVGYEDPSIWPHRRTRDFSPVDSIDQEFLDFTETMLGLPTETGGALAFLTFLEKELHPEIVSRYRVAGDTATLMSNSQGGVFSFFAFLENSPLFDRYWIGSPAIFGKGTYLIDQLSARLEEGFDRPTRVYMSLGELERTLSVNGMMPMEMHQLSAESYTAIDRALRVVVDPNFQYLSKEFEGETHNSVVAPAMSRAYRFLSRKGPVE